MQAVGWGGGVKFFFFKQKTAYEIKECDWSSDVCSSDLAIVHQVDGAVGVRGRAVGQVLLDPLTRDAERFRRDRKSVV